MRNLLKLSHVVWECHYHVIWCPKYRFKILNGEFGHSVRDIIRELCDWKGIEILEGKVMVDQIHLLLSIPPKHSVSSIFGYVKGKSAIKIFDRHPKMKRRYWGQHFWVRGYYASTVGLDEQTIREYVRNQLRQDQAEEQLELFKKR
jgi:putative transposase